MSEFNFHIGDRVKYIGIDGWYAPYGSKGVIIEEERLGQYGVEFDEPVNGHTCNGSGREDHCWYICRDSLELDDFNPSKIKITFNQLRGSA